MAAMGVDLIAAAPVAKEKMELEWRSDGCSEAITSSREGAGQGRFSGFSENSRCSTNSLPSTSICGGEKRGKKWLWSVSFEY